MSALAGFDTLYCSVSAFPLCLVYGQYNNVRHRVDLFIAHRTLCSSQIYFAIVGSGGQNNSTSTAVEMFIIDENVFGGAALGTVQTPLYLLDQAVTVDYQLLPPFNAPGQPAVFGLSRSGILSTLKYLDYEESTEYLLTCAVLERSSGAVLASVGLLVSKAGIALKSICVHSGTLSTCSGCNVGEVERVISVGRCG